MNAETKHSGPVDVRAVLRAAAHTFKSRGELMPHDDLMQAEIAVAELIEAAAARLKEGSGQMTEAEHRLSAALANIGSAS